MPTRCGRPCGPIGRWQRLESVPPDDGSAYLAASDLDRSYAGAMLTCGVLGPLEVALDGFAVEPAGPVVRRLIAALCTAPGEPVPDELLAELIWRDDPPADIHSALRVVVSRVRATLGPVGRDYLQRAPSGYALVCEPTDAVRFARAVADGLWYIDQRLADAAIAAFGTALGLWRGTPWLDLGDDLPFHPARSQLEELREVAVEELQAARLARGETSAAVAALTEAVAESPYRERRWELLALGLYRSGRQAHALAELRRVRTLLVDELGVEPGPGLRTLEQRMLAHDPGLLLVEAPGPQVPMATTRHVAAAPGMARPASAFFGREHDLAALGELLAAQRIVTLIGPAGVGKTRLAVECAADRSGDLEVWPVRLADVPPGDPVVNAVAKAIGIFQLTGDPTTLVARSLAGRPGLLLLDNCEHVVTSVARLALQLTAACPELRILATSRQPLDIDGEHVLTVDPLPIVASGDQDGPAVELLLDRATAARTGWTPTESDRDAARRICTTLDGLPLAIELAAARERAFGLPEIALRLDDRLDVLGRTAHGSISPHVSLDAAIRWSVDQLDEPDRALLLRLWPFEGGFSWQAAEAIQGTPGATLSMLAGLVGRSLITVDRSAHPIRYRMLETIRRHCRFADPDPAGTQAAHAGWVRQLVADNALLLFGARVGQAHQAIDAELANVVSGIGFDIAHRPIDALRSASALEWVWMNLGAKAEGMRLVTEALAAAAYAAPADRAAGLLALSVGDLDSGEPQLALGRIADAIELLRDGDHRLLMLKAFVNQCCSAIQIGDTDLVAGTVARFTEGAAQGPVPDWILACGQICQGALHVMQGQFDDGVAELIAAADLSRQSGCLWGNGTADLLLAWLYLGQDDRTLDRVALTRLASARAAFEQQGNVSDQLIVMYAAAHAMVKIAGPAPAVQLHAAVIEHATRIGADPSRFAGLGSPSVTRRMANLLGDRQASETGRAMTWQAMVQLFTSATSDPLSGGRQQAEYTSHEGQ
jgi:predicted ATPase/DNA-binding SARP family transcriptional activator